MAASQAVGHAVLDQDLVRKFSGTSAQVPARASRGVEWFTQVFPRVGLVGLAIGSVTIDRTAGQVVNTSQGKLTPLSLAQRAGLYRATICKQFALTTLAWASIREMKMGLDRITGSDAVSMMIACGLVGLPTGSLQYNWAIRDTYSFMNLPPAEKTGLREFYNLKIAPGLLWAFIRAAVATGGALYFGPEFTQGAKKCLDKCGVDAPKPVAQAVGGLASGASFALMTQWSHNLCLIAGRLSAHGETAQAPYYTTVAVRTAWRELGPSLFYLNFPARMAIQAVSLAVLTVADVFHRPDLGIFR